MKSKETTNQTQEEFHAAVAKIRNDSVLKASLNYLDNYNVAWGIRAMEECYRRWRIDEKSKVLDKEIRPILKFLHELGKADLMMVDKAEARFGKLIKQKKEQQKQ